MYIVANRLFIASDWQVRLEDRFRERVSSLSQQTGFVSLKVMRPVTEEAPYIVQTEWLSEDAFKAWVGSEDFREAHANPLPKEAYTAPSSMEQHRVTVSSET